MRCKFCLNNRYSENEEVVECNYYIFGSYATVLEKLLIHIFKDLIPLWQRCFLTMYILFVCFTCVVKRWYDISWQNSSWASVDVETQKGPWWYSGYRSCLFGGNMLLLPNWRFIYLWEDRTCSWWEKKELYMAIIFCILSHSSPFCYLFLFIVESRLQLKTHVFLFQCATLHVEKLLWIPPMSSWSVQYLDAVLMAYYHQLKWSQMLWVKMFSRFHVLPFLHNIFNGLILRCHAS